MKMKTILKAGVIFGALLPAFAFAQNDVLELVNLFGEIVAALIPIIVALALLYFLWGLAQFILKRDSAGAEEAKKTMVWGIIALFVMLSVWGIIALLQDTVLRGDNTIDAFDLQYLTPPDLP